MAKFTQVATDAFQKLQLNAGVLLTSFDPSSPTLDKTKIIAATGGGTNFTATPTYIDFGEDIDNVPNNTMELKKIDYYEAKMSGTAKTMDTDFAKMVVAAADVTAATGKVTPRNTLSADDFTNIWWVGDYSDVTTGSGAGFMAIKLINALSTGGFQIQSNDNGKGDFAFEFTGHYSMSDIDTPPFEIYIMEGDNDDTDLKALTIGTLELTPGFNPTVLNYTAATTNSTDTVTATAADNGATVTIKNGNSSVTSGNAATWSTGANALTITVAKSSASKVYTVVVVKS